GGGPGEGDRAPDAPARVGVPHARPRPPRARELRLHQPRELPPRRFSPRRGQGVRDVPDRERDRDRSPRGERGAPRAKASLAREDAQLTLAERPFTVEGP